MGGESSGFCNKTLKAWSRSIDLDVLPEQLAQSDAVRLPSLLAWLNLCRVNETKNRNGDERRNASTIDVAETGME
jgi:hypothetical protein